MTPCPGLIWTPDDGFPAVGDSSRTGHLHNGYDQSTNFWVCTECGYRSIEYYHQLSEVQIPYRRLCKVHRRELRVLPFNDCRCRIAVIGGWRCKTCTIGIFILLKTRADKSYSRASLLVTVFGIWTLIIRPHLNWANWLIWGLIGVQDFLNTATPWEILLGLVIQRRYWHFVKRTTVCPIEGCRRGVWKNPRVMQMCSECKVFLPTYSYRVWPSRVQP